MDLQCKSNVDKIQQRTAMKARLLAENFAMKEKIKDDSVLRTRHIEVIHKPFVLMYFLLAVATHQCKFASERKMGFRSMGNMGNLKYLI